MELRSDKIEVIDNSSHTKQISDLAFDLLINVSNLSPEVVYVLREANADVDQRGCTNGD